MGLVRGVPDEEFHACVSALRDRAEEAGQGFLSAEVCCQLTTSCCTLVLIACFISDQ